MPSTWRCPLKVRNCPKALIRAAFLTISISLQTLALGVVGEVASANANRNPEFLWQPDAGHFGVTLQYVQFPEKTTTTTTVSSATDVSVTQSGNAVRGRFDLGLTENISASVGTSTASRKFSALPSSAGGGAARKSGGLSDVKASVDSAWGNSYRLHIGANAIFTPGTAKEPLANGTDGNEYSGRNSIAPYLGLSIPIAGSSWVGLLASLQTKLEGKIQTAPNGVEETKTDGNVATVLAFWEIPIRSIVLDLAGGVATTDKQKTTTAASSSGPVATPADVDDSYSSTLARVDLKYMFSPATMIGASYLMVMSPERYTYTKRQKIAALNESEISVLLRFGF